MLFLRWLSCLAAILLVDTAHAQEETGQRRFRIRFAESARAEPLTGRVYVALDRVGGTRSPIQQVGETGVPFFGVDVFDVAPGAPMDIGPEAFGHPLASIADLPSGEYSVQAFVNVYTKCERADGHTVFVHLDQGEGQDWRRSPGNLFSEPATIRIDDTTAAIDIVCDQVIPPIALPADTEYVKRIRFQSKILSAWWGQPIYLGATVLLPRGYEEHPDTYYPVLYIQDHYSAGAPGGFGRRSEFTEQWKSAAVQPRFIYVTFQHPTPYYDDSYGVNSANNGPYGDAIMQELIPEVESRFRILREPWARKLSGGSTGGWIAFAMQIFHPDFFGGCWASAPDSPDFRYHQLVNIYEDANAYFIDKGWMRVERPARRRTDGNIESMMKDENHYELVVGDKSRSGGQWDIWEATYGPCGDDGYPRRLWDKRTGVIDHAVAQYWREHYDLRYILESDWATLGPKLKGKLHLYCGDMDDFYLNNGLRMVEAFLRSAQNPPFEGVIEFRPLAGHVWGPRQSEMPAILDAHIRATCPQGTNCDAWQY